MSAPILVADSLRFSTRSGISIIDEVGIDVSEGERLAIIGPNGAGKTTLLRLLCGMQQPSSGAVSMSGRPVHLMRPAERARLFAVVGQSDQVDRRIRVRNYVELGRIPFAAKDRREDASHVDLALERTGLLHLRDREMGSLSGGERQRAQIARALAQQPKILFLDEPTNHLDPRSRAVLLSLVADLRLTVVAVLHDLHLVPAFATHVAVMDQGRLVAQGPASDALAAATIQDVFGIDLLHLQHPSEDRTITVFDIQNPR